MPGGERVKQIEETEDVLVSALHPLVVIAIRSLVENALKFSSDDQLVELGVSCQSWNHQDIVKLIIHDRGHRPSTSNHRNGWPQNSRSPEQGYGLGLTIVESIAEQFSGRLRAEENAIGGMDWELVLPRVF